MSCQGVFYIFVLDFIVVIPVASLGSGAVVSPRFPKAAAVASAVAAALPLPSPLRSPPPLPLALVEVVGVTVDVAVVRVAIVVNEATAVSSAGVVVLCVTPGRRVGTHGARTPLQYRCSEWSE